MGSTGHVFLSGSVSWNQIGGLFGYVLTIGGSLDASKEQLVLMNQGRKAKGQKLIPQTLTERVGVHGGDNLSHMLAACRPVVLRQPVSVATFEHRNDPRAEAEDNLEPDWQDEALRVWKVPVRRARSSEPKKRRLSCSSTNEDGASAEEQFKENATLSNPEYAATVVEKTMFNGKLQGQYLTPKKLGDVTPQHTVFVKDEKRVNLYDGPLTGPDADPNRDVWVIPLETDVVDRDAEVLNLTHLPLPPTRYSESSMCYIVKCQDRRGKFNPVKAKELGVQPSDFGVLTTGKSVKGKDDMVVTPSMVLGETQPGKGFAVVDIESRDFLDSFFQRPEWANTQLMAHVVTIYWILGTGLANDARIQQFVKDHPDQKHIFCAEDTCPNVISLSGPSELQTKLRLIDPERFTLLKYDNAVMGDIPSGPSVEPARTGTKDMLMPRLQFGMGQVAEPPNLVEAAQSVSQEIRDLARKAREETSTAEFLQKVEEDEQDIPSRDAEIIPLGTGSSIPGKYRNVSATLIRVPGIGNYLFDVGEGTLGQIRRLFGDEETGKILKDMKCIVISHLHADHLLGTPSLVKAWYEHTMEDGNARLAISCIDRYRQLLAEVSQVEDIGYHRLDFVSCSPAGDKNVTTAEDLGENKFGLSKIKRISVPHCWLSKATELELTSGLRIAYSGDCRPSPAFARECQGVHLLIHECTFDDDMGSHARKKMHSTVGEALGVARDMKARRTLLTHFSQRYVKSDSLKRGERGETGETLMAFDHMRVKLGEFKRAAAFQPAIAQMLAEAGDK